MFFPKALPIFALALCLAGCAAGGPGALLPAPAVPNISGNWQIDAAIAPTSTAPGLLLIGALESSGTSVTGTFRFSDLANPRVCGLNEVVAVTGTIDPAGNLNLLSNKLQSGSVLTAKLTLPPVLTNFATGTVSVAGTNCAEASIPATAAQIASVTGSFSGPIAPTAQNSSTSAPKGTATLSLTQAATPSADGQFTLTGTLSYILGTCSVSSTVAGNVSGIGLIMHSTDAGLLPGSSLVGFTKPLATQIDLGVFLIPPPACLPSLTTFSSYGGTLLRQ